ncbi:MAG: hypothetical protein OXN85_00035 [Gemmatimonadetes bacterium]|nr:hypothetical protein [Candidatus Palauibacter australiensis]
MIADALVGAAQFTARVPDVGPGPTVGALGWPGGEAEVVFAWPLTANRNEVLSVDQLPVVVQPRWRAVFAMFQSAEPPESSPSEAVLPMASVLFPPAVTSTSTPYVVLAARSIPVPDAVNVLVPLLSEAGLVSVPSVVPGSPELVATMLTVKDAVIVVPAGNTKSTLVSL